MCQRRVAPRAAWLGVPGRVRLAALLLASLLVAGGARAQAPDTESPPVDPPAARLAVGGEVTVTVGPRDPHYFNFTDYYQNANRLTVVTASLAFTATRWLDLVAEVRTENTDRVRLSAAYARVRPGGGDRFALLAGRVPPVFGLFSRTRYGSDNPLVSRPLAYQYLSSLRYDAVAPSIDALLAVRGEGWRVQYPEHTAPVSSPGYGGSTDAPPAGVAPAPGVPLVSTSRWDTGVAAAFVSSRLEASAGLTVGSLSDPRVDDNNGSLQLAGRTRWQPHPSWSLGASAARGGFLSDEAARRAGAGGRAFPQAAIGVDATFEAGHLVVRGEVVHSSWHLPLGEGGTRRRLSARATTVEARYRLHPRLDVAARADRLGFSSVTTASAASATPWDAEVARVEAGVGYRLARQWRLKLAYQHDWRFGATREDAGFPLAQLAVWF